MEVPVAADDLCRVDLSHGVGDGQQGRWNLRLVPRGSVKSQYLCRRNRPEQDLGQVVGGRVARSRRQDVAVRTQVVELKKPTRFILTYLGLRGGGQDLRLTDFLDTARGAGFDSCSLQPFYRRTFCSTFVRRQQTKKEISLKKLGQKTRLNEPV